MKLSNIMISFPQNKCQVSEIRPFSDVSIQKGLSEYLDNFLILFIFI